MIEMDDDAIKVMKADLHKPNLTLLHFLSYAMWESNHRLYNYSRVDDVIDQAIWRWTRWQSSSHEL